MTKQATPTQMPLNTEEASQELYKMGQAAWLDFHRRSVGGAMTIEKHDRNSDTPFDELVNRLNTHMKNGREDIVTAAIADAYSVGAEDVASEIELASKIAATTCILQQANDKIPGKCGYLYAVPICVYGAEPPPVRLGPAKVISEIRESITGFGLFLGNPEINLSDRLVTLDEISSLSYCAVRDITEELSTGGELLLPDPAPNAENGPEEDKTAAAHLRFLLFSVIQDEPSEEENDEPELEDDGRDRAWLEHVQGLINPRLFRDQAQVFMTVGTFDDFYEAQYWGRVEQANVELVAALRSFSLNLPDPEHQYGATLAPFGQNGVASEIRIALLDYTTGELCGAHIYPVIRPEDFDDALGECDQIVRDFNFKPVKTYLEVQSDDGLPPGMTGFLTNAPSVSLLPEVPFPASTMLH